MGLRHGRNLWNIKTKYQNPNRPIWGVLYCEVLLLPAFHISTALYVCVLIPNSMCCAVYMALFFT